MDRIGLDLSLVVVEGWVFERSMRGMLLLEV